MRLTRLILALASLAANTAWSADTLVVAPLAYAEALTPWVHHREVQGHTLRIALPPTSAQGLHVLISDAASKGASHVVLIGDAAQPSVTAPDRVPTAYRAASISSRYSGDPTIATDHPFADLDGDTLPELSIGRIPCRNSQELHDYLARVIRFENEEGVTPPLLNIVASPGRFSPLVDSLIEFTAHQALHQLTPKQCRLCALYNSPLSAHFPVTPFRAAVLSSLQQPALAWVYLGHGSPAGLDLVEPKVGSPPMLTCSDLPRSLPTGRGPVVAAMLACETGRFDGAEECLAESMVLCPCGPLAVIASSRVCMPYGNSVLGIEMLSCLFERPGCIGDCVREGKRRALRADSPLPLRKSVRQLGLGVSPNADRLDEEVVEHVLMYNLLGDPLLRVSGPGS